MFNLKTHEAVVADETVIAGLSNNTYRIGGQEFSVGYLGRPETYRFKWPFTEDYKLEVRKDKPIKILHYLYNGGVLSVEEFDKIKSEIYDQQLSQYWDEDSDEYVYPTLEEEFEVRKAQESLRNDYTAVYSEKGYYWEDVALNIVGEWVDTGSEWITTPFSFGMTTYGSGAFQVSSSALAWHTFKNWCNNNDKKYDGDNLRFVKVDGSYVFGTRFDHTPYIKSSSSVRVFKTIEEAKDYEEEVRSSIIKHMNSLFLDQELKDRERKSVIEDLRLIKTSLLGMDVKVKSNTSKRQVLNKIEKVINNLGGIV